MVSQICQIGAEKLFFSVFSTRDSLTNKTKQKKKEEEKTVNGVNYSLFDWVKIVIHLKIGPCGIKNHYHDFIWFWRF